MRWSRSVVGGREFRHLRRLIFECAQESLKTGARLGAQEQVNLVAAVRIFENFDAVTLPQLAQQLADSRLGGRE